MKQLKSFIKKEFFHILRDPRTMLILFGIPITQLLIFGTVIKNEISDVQIAIYDQSKDETTMQITNKLLSSGYFILNQNLESTDGIDAIFKKGKVKQVIVFENDFGQKLIREGKAGMQLIADATDPNLARLVTSYTAGIVNDYIKKMHPNLQMPLKIEPEVRMYFNEEMKSAYQFVPGTMALILMLISALMTSISITREKEMGTMEILLVSPLKPLADNYWQSTALSYSFCNKWLYHCVNRSFCFWRAGYRKFYPADAGNHPFYSDGALPGHSNFHSGKKPDGGHVYFHDCTDVAHHHTFGIYFSH
jgi:ABC-2 type transport system permease protein